MRVQGVNVDLAAKVKFTCPICKKRVHPDWIGETDIDLVKKNGKVIKLRAWLAECCSQLFLREGEGD